MDMLQCMRLFAKVVREGSFTGSAQQLDLTTSYVSRAVSSLEAHLRTRLLHRTTRRISLTSAGERYFKRCSDILSAIDEAEAEAADVHKRPAGILRIHTLASFGLHYLMPMISGYRKKYPEVEVELTLSQHSPDILREGFDVAVIVTDELPDSSLISQRLGSTYSIALASSEYIREHGKPEVPADLANHECLKLSTPSFSVDAWRCEGPGGTQTVSVKGAFRVNIAESMAEAIEAGMGIGILPLYSALDGLSRGSFVRVLPECQLQKANIYQVYLSRQFIDATIASWLQHVRDNFEGMSARDENLLDARSAKH